MTNIFIGLFKRHRFLIPYSIHIHEIGYTIQSIEPSFQSNNRTINPEAIACSNTKEHTLLTEWTSAQALSYDKKQQISRYLAVTSNDLINNANIESTASVAHSLWVTVRPDSLESFKEIINNNNHNRILLCSFDELPTGEYCIDFHLGNLLDNELSLILQQTIKFDKIPQGYIPLPIDNLKNERFKDAVIQEIVNRLVKVKSEYEFSIEDICASIFSIWSYVGDTKKKSIRNAVKKIMREISNTKDCKKWLKYENSNWKVYDFSKSKLNKFLENVKSNNFFSEDLNNNLLEKEL
jgi:hypothetical protein